MMVALADCAWFPATAECGTSASTSTLTNVASATVFMTFHMVHKETIVGGGQSRLRIWECSETNNLYQLEFPISTPLLTALACYLARRWHSSGAIRVGTLSDFAATVRIEDDVEWLPAY